ncbi:hypothetical protein G6O69_17220 [Pseudenhygromyxa sp. WMMC2535]|uniref:hypothetical protein n=1 Tax=Pseudenhygromyxa sp. WMMC2535 TaxID=2712867 RepID=UPI001551941F|nr:hypothetical protein [Pseudenhygromyxa sp. WMMC2535]NVB39586.1 hypothetical protein [Pseudenhygromyxa sp. WMMC2535]
MSMYAFSKDQSQLVFMDCFGLTRLGRDQGIATNTTVGGSDSAGRVSISASGSLAASHGSPNDPALLWTVADLQIAERLPRRGVTILPAGTHYLLDAPGSLELVPLSRAVRLPLRLDAPARPKAESRTKPRSAPIPLDLAGRSATAARLPALALGHGTPEVPRPIHLAHDGTLLCWDREQLVCATLTGAALSPRWRRTITTAPDARLELYADAQRCVLLIHHGRRWTVDVLAGDDAWRFDIESLGVPTVAGRWLAYQPAHDRVLRLDLGGADTSEHPLPSTCVGVGSIFASAEGRLYFLPAHRESVLNLHTGEAHSRQLPADQLEARRAILATALPYRDAAQHSGVTIELERVELDSRQASASLTHRLAGSGPLLAALLAGHSHSAWRRFPMPPGWQLGSHGSRGEVRSPDEPTAGRIVDSYAALASAGVGFATTTRYWAKRLEDDQQQLRDPAALALLAQALLAIVRDGPDTPADFNTLLARGWPTLDDATAAFAHYPQRTRQLDDSVTALAGALFNLLLGVEAARLWSFIYIDTPWPNGVGSHYGDFDRKAIRPLLRAHPKTAQIFRAKLRTPARPDDPRRFHLDQLRDLLA